MSHLPPPARRQRGRPNQAKPKGRRSEPEGFLSRLFGSRRQKMRSSIGEGDAARVVGGTRGSGEPPRLSYYQPSSNYQLPPTQQPPALSSPSPPPPTRHKTKPPAPPPPDSPPPLQGKASFPLYHSHLQPPLITLTPRLPPISFTGQLSVVRSSNHAYSQVVRHPP